MKKILSISFAVAGAFTMAAQAAFLIEVDTDGTDDGVLTFNPNFAFGGDTTTASQSSPSSAFGMNGGDSIFGGDGTANSDTYVFTYDPSSDADNLVAPAGTALNNDGDVATGFIGGTAGTYAVYGTWPFGSNVSGGLTNFSAVTSGDSFNLAFDQTAAGAGTGNEWYKLGEIDWTSGAITLSQSASNNTFVSMRSAGVLFEQIPEPSSGLLLGLGLAAAALRRRR